MKINLQFLLFAALLFTIASCKKDDPEPAQPYEDFILIGNQGAWGSNNGSITAYNPETKESVQDVFNAENNYLIGDLVQSLFYFNENLYVCVAGSDKIEIVDRKTLKIKDAIQGVENPRYMMPVSTSKAYVSSWEFGGNSEIAVVNLLNNTKTGSIAMGWVESMVIQGDHVWATGHDTSVIHLIKIEDNTLDGSVPVNYAPQSIIKDNTDKVWVLSWGEKSWMATTNNNTAGSITRINPSNNTIEKQFFFPDVMDTPTNLTIDPTLNTLYFISEGNLYKMDINATALPATPMVDLPQRLYSVGVSYNKVYVSEEAFTSNGKVYVYDSENESLVDSITAGIGPSSFSF